MKKYLLILFGFLCLGLGAIGLFLPVWPTTPFVLVAVGCFSGSPSIRARILKIGFIREHYQNYTARTGLPRKTLLISLAFLWCMLVVSMICMNKLWSYVGLSVVGLAVTVHLLYMAKAVKAEPQKRSDV